MVCLWSFIIGLFPFLFSFSFPFSFFFVTLQRFSVFMAVLRDYQKDICSRIDDAWANCRSVMAQMPTGTGKTVVLASIINGALRATGRGGVSSVLIVAHRRELVEQISRTVGRFVGSRSRLLERIHVKIGRASCRERV